MTHNKNNVFSTKSMVTLIVFFAVGLIVSAPSRSLAASVRVNYVKQQLISSGTDKMAVDNLFSDKRIKLYSFKSVAYKPPNWNSSEKRLLSSDVIQAGLNYIESNTVIFEKAEKDFGVRKEILAGILAIETNFGKNAGNYTTFNVLYSKLKQLSPTKWKGEANELIALSQYCLKSHIDCFSIKGSYAGAFGLVQFMPSSLLTYGVDGDNDGIIDLLKPADAIPSAANFLKNHGWQQNELAALTHYYGSPIGYPKIVLDYALLLKN